MATIRPFQGIRPQIEYVEQIAALPYDVYSSEEAREIVEKNPLSFLRIDRAETNFDVGQDMYAPCVYEKAGSLIREWMQKGYLLQEDSKVYYLYELTMNGRVQTGIVAVAAVDDYNNQVIMKHENTRSDKELSGGRNHLAFIARSLYQTVIFGIRLLELIRIQTIFRAGRRQWE